VLGEEVSVISETDGNLILKIKDGRIAIDKSMALKIVVEKIA
jgi:Fe2+ transport system protein FeoA